LASTDYTRGHLSVLGVLTQAPDVGAEAWEAQFQAMRSEPAAYYVVVVVSRETDQIVASGGVFVERKFLRGLGRVGHIEDIAVSREMQGKKLGLRMIQALTQISEDVGCYKTILNCNENNIGTFYVTARECSPFTFFFSVLREVRLRETRGRNGDCRIRRVHKCSLTCF
jgi:glucosamine-phosphate N-acetyltransferase